VDDFICQDGDLKLDFLGDAQPVESGERFGDVVELGSPQVIDQPRSAMTRVVGPNRPEPEYVHTYMKFITRSIVEDGSNQRRGLLLGGGV